MDCKTIDIKLFSLICLLFLFINNGMSLWDNHNITTLRLLQVVSRHGDRTVTKIYPKDPFSDITKYWPQGLGELTNLGKYRMYQLGQFIRRQYQQYLGSDFNVNEVYARSSAKKRCLESLSSCLAGVYPPNNDKWKWSKGIDSELGNNWQPIPIYTVPIEHMNEDRLLRTEAFCPKVNQEMNFLENSQLVQNSIKNEKQFLQQLSQLIGLNRISTLLDAKNVYDHLLTQFQQGYKWSDFNRWSVEDEKQVFNKLLPLSELLWITEWNSSVVQRLRAGPLIQELTKNFRNFINGDKNSKKIHFYSTHDSMIAVLMHSLQVFNNKVIPLRATLFFELHQHLSIHKYFVRLYYFNETINEKNPHILRLPGCNHDDNCPLEIFFNITDKLIPEDWDKECGLSLNDKSLLFSSLNISLIVLNLFFVLIFALILILIFKNKRIKSVYQTID